MTDSKLVGCGFWIRIAAYLLDELIFTLVIVGLFLLLALFVPLGEVSTVLSEPNSNVGFGSAGLALLYRVCFEASSMQGTPGKYFVGLKIVTVDGAQISPFRALARSLVRSITLFVTLGLGFFVILLSGRKRALHDMISGTMVVKA